MYAEKQHSALLDGICWLIFEIALDLHTNRGKETSLLFVIFHMYIKVHCDCFIFCVLFLEKGMTE